MIPTRTLTDREATLAQLKSLAEGNDHMIPLLGEELGGEDGTFASLKKDPAKAEGFAAILQRTFETALWRDALYGSATRGQLLAHGYNCERRIHYEASRIAQLAGI